MVYQPDRERYIKLLREKGLHTALSELHKEIWTIEQECFEGQGGYNPEIYEDLKNFRRFSTELWNLNHETEAEYPKNAEEFNKRSYGVWGYSDRPRK